MEVRPNGDGSFTVTPTAEELADVEWVANNLGDGVDTRRSGAAVLAGLIENVADGYVIDSVQEAAKMDGLLQSFASLGGNQPRRPRVDATAPAEIQRLYGVYAAIENERRIQPSTLVERKVHIPVDVHIPGEMPGV